MASRSRRPSMMAASSCSPIDSGAESVMSDRPLAAERSSWGGDFGVVEQFLNAPALRSR